MSSYLVEAHATFQNDADFAEVQRRLETHDDVLREPAPQIIPPDAVPYAIVQFTVESRNQVHADSKARDVATDVLRGDGDEALAELGLVSARSMEGHTAADDAPLAADGRSEPESPSSTTT